MGDGDGSSTTSSSLLARTPSPADRTAQQHPFSPRTAPKPITVVDFATRIALADEGDVTNHSAGTDIVTDPKVGDPVTGAVSVVDLAAGEAVVNRDSPMPIRRVRPLPDHGIHHRQR